MRSTPRTARERDERPFGGSTFAATSSRATDLSVSPRLHVEGERRRRQRAAAARATIHARRRRCAAGDEQQRDDAGNETRQAGQGTDSGGRWTARNGATARHRADYNRPMIALAIARLPHRAASGIAQSRRAPGFTLIEILVVIVILGILAALVVPRVLERPDEARVVAAKSDIATIMQALKLYRLDNQRYPTTEQGLAALVARPTQAPVPAELEAERLSRAAAEGSVGTAVPVPESGPARRDRRLQLRRRRAARRHRHRRRHRIVGPLIAPRGHRRPRRRSPRGGGFTLVELLVVLVIIGLVAGDRRRSVSAATSAGRPSARRSGSPALSSMPRRRAVARARRSASRPTARGYRFWRRDADDRWSALADDDVLAPRTLPAGITVDARRLRRRTGRAGCDPPVSRERAQRTVRARRRLPRMVARRSPPIR